MIQCSTPGCINTARKDNLLCSPCGQRSDRAWDRLCEEAAVEMFIAEGNTEEALKALLDMVKELRKCTQ